MSQNLKAILIALTGSLIAFAILPQIFRSPYLPDLPIFGATDSANIASVGNTLSAALPIISVILVIGIFATALSFGKGR